jgi:ABC-type glutathione transport system ATPase component
MIHLLEARNLRKSYHRGGGPFANTRESDRFAAVDNVSFQIAAGETFAVVGESGSGKTTLARMLLRLVDVDAGEIFFEGKNLLQLSGPDLRAQRKQMQMIFQDPFASLNPRMRVGEIVAEPLVIHEPGFSAAECHTRMSVILRRVGLDESAVHRYPHEFSGGQRQRIGIARALILVVADEPVSALDVSVGAQVLVLLKDLQREFGLTYFIISHSLPVVAQMATHIAVMRGGQFVECGLAEDILRRPTQSYTRDLLAAVPEPPETAPK